MAVVVDTSHLIELERGTSRAADLEDKIGDQERAISVVTVSELLHGVHRARDRERAERLAFVERVIAGLTCLAIDETIARVHARLGADLALAGTPIGTHDLWIASTALVRGIGVATHDRRDFSRVPSLRLVVTDL